MRGKAPHGAKVDTCDAWRFLEPVASGGLARSYRPRRAELAENRDGQHQSGIRLAPTTGGSTVAPLRVIAHGELVDEGPIDQIWVVPDSCANCLIEDATSFAP